MSYLITECKDKADRIDLENGVNSTRISLQIAEYMIGEELDNIN